MVTKIVAEERREEVDLKEKAHHQDPNLHLQDIGQDYGPDKYRQPQRVKIRIENYYKFL